MSRVAKRQEAQKMVEITKQVKAYMDLTEQFPRQSLTGNKYIMVVYAYTPNAIIIRALKYRSKGDILKCFQNIMEHLSERGFLLTLNIMDNEASRKLKITLPLK